MVRAGPAGPGKEVSGMDTDNAELIQDLIARMRRIEGQARGVQKMLESNRNCEEIVMQLSAMRAAISKVALAILAGNMEKCFRSEDGSRETIERATRIFMKFS